MARLPGQTDTQTNRRSEAQRYTHKDRYSGKQTDRQIDRRKGIDIRTDTQGNRQIDRQTDRWMQLLHGLAYLHLHVLEVKLGGLRRPHRQQVSHKDGGLGLAWLLHSHPLQGSGHRSSRLAPH